MPNARLKGGTGMAVLASDDPAGWAGLMAALPADIAERLAGLQAIAGVTCIAQYGAEGHPLAIVVGQRRPAAAMMRIALAWTAGGFMAADGQRLLEALETDALAQNVFCLRADEDTASRLGGQWQRRDGFLQRWIGIEPSRRQDRIPPSWPQTAGFTCGPSALAMAMAGLDPALLPDRALEVELWREATTIIGPSGPGGCDPYGLALAAHRRGLRTEVFMSSAEPIFLDRASSEERRGLMAFVQTGFRREVEAASLPNAARAFAVEELAQALDRGLLALVLIDQAPMMGYTCPHWVLVHGRGDGVFFLNDPWIEPDRAEQAMDVVDLPILEAELDRMAWYGNPAYRAAVLVGSGTFRA
ncbi:peptidase C39 family protein [Mesorhizobium sp. BH1-1-4]|uniref:peptidase C39 family protein n=1 Tax=Mesorhizobium sp. BH1-1-4 TaxID=2876662 RepID=UPI001CD122BE|nr:peptidase C39 family protein [Mesorhizobium sp. BH1-1-4]MBZ9997848.1 peptidase C39 family protein [Mesorhizobium sp. BH1-1-4]